MRNITNLPFPGLRGIASSFGRAAAGAILLAGALASSSFAQSGSPTPTPTPEPTATPTPTPTPTATPTPVVTVTVGDPWISTWGTAASNPANDTFFLPSSYQGTNTFDNQTIRMVVHLSLGGKKLRVRFSNEQGTTPVALGAAHVAVSDGFYGTVAGTDRTLTFDGEAGVTLPAGAPVLSDPVKLDVPDGANLAVSIYLPGTVTVTSGHSVAIQNNYVAAPGTGDSTGAPTLPIDPAYPVINQWPLLSGIEVKPTAPGAGTVVALGSSITDGFNSTMDANARWPDVLAKRLYKRGLPLAVINPSIVAGRILNDGRGPSALARFDRDVLARPGVKYVIVADSAGVDVNGGTSAADVINGLRQIITRAHSQRVKVIGTTILPVYGFIAYSPESETKRQTVNAFIRTSPLFDGSVDFDAVIRDPANPIQINPVLDSGDHHHPNDEGYALMAQAIPLSLFQ